MGKYFILIFICIIWFNILAFSVLGSKETTQRVLLGYALAVAFFATIGFIAATIVNCS